MNLMFLPVFINPPSACFQKAIFSVTINFQLKKKKKSQENIFLRKENGLIELDRQTKSLYNLTC